MQRPTLKIFEWLVFLRRVCAVTVYFEVKPYFVEMNMCSEVKSVGNGLLTVSEDILQQLIRKDSIENIYYVEQTPFAR